MARVPELVPKVTEILVETAQKRKRTTYGEVARAVGTHARVVPQALEVIRAQCLQNGWPPLTAIVVSSTTRRPGDAFLDPWLPRDADPEARDALTAHMTEKVYAFDWTPLIGRPNKG